MTESEVILVSLAPDLVSYILNIRLKFHLGGIHQRRVQYVL